MSTNKRYDTATGEKASLMRTALSKETNPARKGDSFVRLAVVVTVACFIVGALAFWYMLSGGQRYKVSLLYYPLNTKNPTIIRTHKKVMKEVKGSKFLQENPFLMMMAKPVIDDLLHNVYHAEICLTSSSGVRTKLMFTNSGVREHRFEVKPNPIWQAPRELELGAFAFDKEAFIESIPGEWRNADYDVIEHNCVNFADAFCKHIGTLDNQKPIGMRKNLLESTKGQVDIFKAVSLVKQILNFVPDAKFVDQMKAQVVQDYGIEVPAVHVYHQA